MCSPAASAFLRFEVRDLCGVLAAVAWQLQLRLHKFWQDSRFPLWPRRSDRRRISAFEDHLVEHCMSTRKNLSNRNGSKPISRAAGGAELRRELNAENKFVVSYIGTIGMATAWNRNRAAARLRDGNPKLCSDLGEGAEKEKSLLWHTSVAHQPALHRSAPREKFPLHRRLGRLLFCSRSPTYSKL